MIAFNVLIQQYTTQTEVQVTPDCNAWAARNLGNDTCWVNGTQLLANPAPGLTGESASFSGNDGEIYKGRIQIRFAGVGTTPLVEITQKFYLPDQKY